VQGTSERLESSSSEGNTQLMKIKGGISLAKTRLRESSEKESLHTTEKQ
jgi:hypothetical protein